MPPIAPPSTDAPSAADPVSRHLPPLAAAYLPWALPFLALTVLSGAWLRGALVRSDLLLGFNFGDAVHAHSHLAFFGWVSMALFALLLRGIGFKTGGAARRPTGLRRTLLEVHPGLVGVASALAFVAFLREGYAPASIALSVLHVGLWVAFALAVWPLLASRPPRVRAFHRAALVFLVVAGAGTVAPAVVMIRGIGDAWASQLAVGLFLVPFVSGWMALGVMGTLYEDGPDDGSPIPAIVLGLLAAGVLPATLAYPSAGAPHPGLGALGRLGLGAVGAATLLFAVHRGGLVAATSPRSHWDPDGPAVPGPPGRGAASRPFVHRLPGFGGLALLSAGLAGALQLLLAAGIGAEIAHGRGMVVAFLHLVLLGFVSPALLAGLGGSAGPLRVGLWGGGLTVMLGALVVGAVPALLGASVATGVGYPTLMWIALAGGIAVAGAALPELRRLRGSVPGA